MERAGGPGQALHRDRSDQPHLRAQLPANLPPYPFHDDFMGRKPVLDDVHGECGEALRHGGDADRGSCSTEGGVREAVERTSARVVGEEERCDK